MDTLKHVPLETARDFCGTVKGFAANNGKQNFFLVGEFAPAPHRRLGVLVDHLVEGSKEQRLATDVGRRYADVLVTGHPFVDVWEGVRPKVLGIEAWPQVPRGQPWKDGVCAALGVDPARFWPQLRNRVRSFADLRPELVGAVERLVDFVAPPSD